MEALCPEWPMWPISNLILVQFYAILFGLCCEHPSKEDYVYVESVNQDIWNNWNYRKAEIFWRAWVHHEKGSFKSANYLILCGVQKLFEVTLRIKIWGCFGLFSKTVSFIERVFSKSHLFFISQTIRSMSLWLYWFLCLLTPRVWSKIYWGSKLYLWTKRPMETIYRE